MPTLILSPRHTPNSQKLWRVAIDQEWDVIRLPSFRTPVEWEKNPPEDPVLYGEPLFNTMVADALGLEIDTPPDDFLIQIGRNFSGRHVQLLTVSEARSIDKPTFFKPPLHKTFKAGVYESGLALPDSLEKDELVLCQDVVRWIDEYRFFVLDGYIKAESCYINTEKFVGDSTGEANRFFMQSARELVKKMLTRCRVLLPRAVVIDAGIYVDKDTQDYLPAIIEANEAPASGLYQCEPEAVLQVLKNATRNPRGKVSNTLSPNDMKPGRQCPGKVVSAITGQIVHFTDGTVIQWIAATTPTYPTYDWKYVVEPPAYKVPN